MSAGRTSHRGTEAQRATIRTPGDANQPALDPRSRTFQAGVRSKQNHLKKDFNDG